MSKKLAIVAISGIVAGTVLLGTAALVGGQELRRQNWDIGALWGDERCGVDLSQRHGSRSLDWTGGDRIGIRIPADVRYRRGQGEQVVIEGDEALLPLIRIEDSRVIRMNCNLRGRSARFTITLPGRDFRSYDLAGSVDLTLEDIDQPRLDFDIAGAVQVTAKGKVDELDLDAAGSSEGHFGELAANVVTIDMAGSSEVEVAPRDRLSVDAAGSSRITLRTEPQTIDMDIAGSGRIIHPDGTVTRANGFSSRHWERDDARDRNRDQNRN
jgi:hypothetical protein